MASELVKISGHVENYHWGNKGPQSAIYKYIKNPAADLPYAELWFGAHPRAPSPLSGQTSKNLRELIQSSPAKYLGSSTCEKYKSEFPFLLKILSIGSALSIQLHPDKINAALLHQSDSKNYPDNNHKPEIAVAISEVHLLYGFRPISEIKKVLRKTPEFELFIDKNRMHEINSARETNRTKDYIKLIYGSVLHADKSNYRKASENLIKRIKSYTKLNRHEKAVLEIAAEYGPEDLAIFTVLLMNYVVLQPGQAIFTYPNTLHAFLKGDLLECMANSDNVIRAGMTPKFKDIQRLESLVEHKMGLPKVISPHITAGPLPHYKYEADCEEFTLELFKGSGSFKSKNNSNVCLLLCIEGCAEVTSTSCNVSLSQGEACFVSADCGNFLLEAKNAVIAFARAA